MTTETFEQLTTPGPPGLLRRVDFQLPDSVVEAELEARARALQKTYRLKGFRPGKVPVSLIRRKGGARFRNEILHGLLKDEANRLVEEDAEGPTVGDPSVSILPDGEVPESDSDVEGQWYRLHYELRPTVPSLDLEGLELTTFELSVSEEAVEVGILDNADIDFLFREAEPNRAAQMGDLIQTVRQFVVGDEVFPAKGETVVHFVLDETSTTAAMVEYLRGCRAGEVVSVRYPAELALNDKRYREKTGEYRFTIQEIRSRFSAEESDARAKEKSGETLAGAREIVRQQLQSHAGIVARNLFRLAALDALGTSQNFVVHPSLAMNLAGGYARNCVEAERRFPTVDEETRPLIRDPDLGIGLACARFLLVLEAIAERLRITVDAADLLRAREGWVEESPVTEEKLAELDQMLRHSPALRVNLRRRARIDKTLDMVAARATIRTERIDYLVGLVRASERAPEWNALF